MLAGETSLHLTCKDVHGGKCAKAPNSHCGSVAEPGCSLDPPGSRVGAPALTTHFFPKVLLHFGFHYEALMGFPFLFMLRKQFYNTLRTISNSTAKNRDVKKTYTTSAKRIRLRMVIHTALSANVCVMYARVYLGSHAHDIH